MALAFVRQTIRSANGFVTGDNTLSAITTTGGNLLVCCFTTQQAISITNVKDNAGNTWVQVPGATENTVSHVDIWYVASVAGGSTAVTVTFSANNNCEIVFSEFSGQAASPLLTGSGAILTNPSGAPIGPTLSPTATGQLLFSICSGNAINLTGVNTPWTGYVHVTAQGGCTAYLIDAASSPTHATFTPTTAQGFGSDGAIFLPSLGGPPLRTLMGVGL